MKSVRTLRYLGAIALIASLGTAAPLLAQRGRGGGGMGVGNYDPAAEVTLNGTVDEVRTIPGPAGGPGGLHLTVHTDLGISNVHVGPVTFTHSMNFEFAKGDVIGVTGSRVMIDDREAIIAREIKKGDRILILRDARGVPLWAGAAR